MRIRSILGALVIAALPFTSVWAENMTPEDIKKLVDEAVTKRLQEHERREGAIEQEGSAAAPTAEPGSDRCRKSVRIFVRTHSRLCPLAQPAQVVWSMPSHSSRRRRPLSADIWIFSFDTQQKGSIEAGDGRPGVTNNFDQQRFVPFIYADVTEHVKVATELEIEHGVRESSENEIEVSLEFGFIDYLVNEPFNLRAGILLMPLGKFNLLHDSPLNDLTDRPLVSQLIIPSTMSETGAGFYGTFYPGRTGKMDYELYVTTGPCGYSSNGTPLVNEADGTSQGRQRTCAGHDGADINNGKAVVGRLAYSPMLGVEVGGSSYYGNANNNGSNYAPLNITALDWTLQKGPFEVIGEAAWAYARGNSRAVQGNSIGFAPGSLLTGIGGNSGMETPPQRMSGLLYPGQLPFHAGVLVEIFPEAVWPRLHLHCRDPV